MKRYLIGLLLAVTLLFMSVPVNPVYAMANPDNIAFGTGATPAYRAFYNVYETGDILFAAEGYVNYTVTQNITAGQAFSFQVLNSSGNVTYLSTALTAYGDRPIGIYATANQTSALGLSIGGSYMLSIRGNPLIFPTPAYNSVNATLGAGDWYDDSVNHNTYNDYLRLWVINGVNGVALNMQNHDGVALTTPYITYVQGYNYLTTTGGNLFISGIPNINVFCPILFQASLAPLTAAPPVSTGNYSANLTPTQQLGNTVGAGLTNLGLWLGLNQSTAGSMILLGVGLVFSGYIFRRTESGVAVLFIIMLLPFVGAYLGLMPMALAFTFTMVVLILTLYYFFTRGIL